MLFSLLESALMTINSLIHIKEFHARTTQLALKFPVKDGETPSDEYIEERHAIDAEKILVSKASERNAPIVVLNHLSTVLLGALLPISLDVIHKRPIETDICSKLDWLGYDPCPISILGAGSESLTFFSVSLLLIIFGKIVPEKIGRKHNVSIIRNFRGLIDAMSVVVGWIVKPILAIGDFFLLSSERNLDQYSSMGSSISAAFCRMDSATSLLASTVPIRSRFSAAFEKAFFGLWSVLPT